MLKNLIWVCVIFVILLVIMGACSSTREVKVTEISSNQVSQIDLNNLMVQSFREEFDIDIKNQEFWTSSQYQYQRQELYEIFTHMITLCPENGEAVWKIVNNNYKRELDEFVEVKNTYMKGSGTYSEKELQVEQSYFQVLRIYSACIASPTMLEKYY